MIPRRIDTKIHTKATSGERGGEKNDFLFCLYKSKYITIRVYLHSTGIICNTCERILKEGSALGSVAQWIEYRPVNQKVEGLVPSHGTCLGCRPGPQ